MKSLPLIAALTTTFVVFHLFWRVPAGSRAEAPSSAPATGSAPATSTSSAPEDENAPGNNLRGGPQDVHALLLDDSAAIFSQGATDQVTIETKPPGVAIPRPVTATAPAAPPRTALYTSRVITTDFPFNDLVPSWNVEVPEQTGFMAEIRVGRKEADTWTTWYYFGVWGIAPAPVPAGRAIGDADGVIDVDTFRSTKTFDRIQYRFTLLTAAAGQSPTIRRVAMAYSNTLDDAALAARFRKPIDPGPPAGWVRRLPVPWRSQTVEEERIRHSICSPTSVSMVMQFYGINVPTSQVARTVYDSTYRMYGNWIRAVQTAYSFGIVGHLERFGDFEGVKRHIAAGHPVIASIRIDKGDIRIAPTRSSNGHLVVITGFDDKGNVCINDPAGKTPESGVVTYDQQDMKKIWLDHGGVGYVLLGKGK
jgi:hypothetical protein